MRRDSGDTDESFAAYVRDRGDHHLRVAVLITGTGHHTFEHTARGR